VANFAELFWSRTPEEDLSRRDVDDDAGATIDSWRKFAARDPDAAQIWIDNPLRARDGWQSSHTVVRVMTPDMPFVVDSVLMALSQDGLTTHHFSNVVFSVRRLTEGGIEKFSAQGDAAPQELFIYAEIDRVEADAVAGVHDRLRQTLSDLQAVVGDYSLMTQQLESIVEELRQNPPPLSRAENRENIAFLEWLSASRFTFLGYREFDYRGEIIRQSGQPLGMLRLRRPASDRLLADQPADTRAFLLEPVGLTFSKSGTKSRVHRPAYPDYVGIQRFNADGEVIGEYGFLGLYTSRVYMEHPDNIPMLRRKVKNVIARSNLDPNGFDGKVLAQVLATYPRAELFEMSEDQLFANALAITYIHERRRTRVFTRYGRYGLFVNCLVFLPRDLFNTQSRTRVQDLLTATFDAEDLDYDAYISESTLVRLEFVLRIRPGARPSVNPAQLEQNISELIGDWTSELNAALIAAFGETQGRRTGREFADAFPAGYRERFAARLAVDDVASIQQLSAQSGLLTRFYRRPEDTSDVLRLKVIHLGEPLPLSEVIPQLENLGLRTMGMHPYRVSRAEGPVVSIHDFELVYQGPLDLADAGPRFNDAFVQIWQAVIENDGYNRLILGAGLSWRQVAVLRTYALYMTQIRFGFSQSFISDTLAKHEGLSALLVSYFENRFTLGESQNEDAIRQAIEQALDSVDLLNEDRILRKILELMAATVRTNYYVRSAEDTPRPYLSIKILPAAVTNMPQPAPAYEIFVNAPHFEGAHLRGGAIARGGLRWSDRREDYRTEVLGLMKAQIVKNAVIVPTGAKGGFVLKPVGRNGHNVLPVQCYREFIGGLLDLTDNIVNGDVVPPANVRRHDDDDPYLVVAADKGTASFSDEANAVAEAYGFWLGDAFASGGSNGYDHKKMGITARGAWVSVQRHFAERGIDVQRDNVSVLGIGDMSGDVFGNGMLLSDAIKLVAAFNHQHIFIDPDPDPKRSFAERQRLFAATAGWTAYDPSLISTGGGVYSRQAKSIALNDQMRALLDVHGNRITPDELIHALLKAPVQLIWNGGIGTYVKARHEHHADADDRANDHLRVNADELRCQVFGEGGNLGLTQAARIEFSLNGGALNTDFIDNSAGVDCSDHEVNIKITLDEIVAAQDITPKQRNELLLAMTEEVAQLVLNNNARQAQTLSLARRHSGKHQTEYQRFIDQMEADELLDRELEFIPDDDELGERFGRGSGFSRPELAVLLAYAKIHIKRNLVQSNIHQDPLIAEQLTQLFPKTLINQRKSALLQHRLKSEILATQLANDVVHHMGITFVSHLMDSVGGNVSEIIRAYFAAAESFSIREHCRAIERLVIDDEALKLELLLEQIRLGRRVTRWIMRHQRQFFDSRQFIDTFKQRIHLLDEPRADLTRSMGATRFAERMAQLREAGIPEQLARNSAGINDIAVTLPIISAAADAGTDLLAVAQAYGELGQALNFAWLTEQLTEMPTSSHWQAMEQATLSDDITTHQSLLAAAVVKHANGNLGDWMQTHPTFTQSWQRTIEDVQHSITPDFSLYSMACRKLDDLCRGLVANT
jgi:glutamate dehydrogenase